MAAAENLQVVGTSSAVKHWDIMQLVTALSSAACEWFLIFLLFLYGMLSCLMNEFARYCRLPTPCLFCSRLDHYFGNKKPGLYQGLICNNHQLEISMLLHCQIHSKLAAGHGMCDDCLFSNPTNSVFNRASHRLPMKNMSRMLGQPDRSGYGDNYSCSASGSVDRKSCSCCHKSLKIQQRAVRYRSPVRGVSRPNTLPNVPSQKKLSRRNIMRRLREKPCGSLYSNHLGSDILDPLASVGYRVIKVTSDSESEAPYSDGGNGGTRMIEKNSFRGDIGHQSTSESLTDIQTSIFARMKPVNKTYTIAPSVYPACIKPAALGLDHCPALAADAAPNQRLFSVEVSSAVKKSNLLDLPELISLDESIPTANLLVGPPDVATDQHGSMTPPTLIPNLVMPPDIISSDVACSSISDLEMPVKALLDKSQVIGHNHETARYADLTSEFIEDKLYDSKELADSTSTHVAVSAVTGLRTETSSCANNSHNHEISELPKILKSTSELPEILKSTFELTQDRFDDHAPLDLREHGESSGTSICTVNNEGTKLSISDEKEISSTMQDMVKEKCKLSMANEESIQELDLQSETSSSECMMAQAAELNDKPEYAIESTPGSMVNDIEGESLVDKLQRQVEHDKKCIDSLYKELDEERSASAIAANQAMAMITRLQEEKAAVNMEALHYLRMMEEQAEHDIEALERANDLLSEKEKEIQDLEAELEYYRCIIPNESMAEDQNGIATDAAGSFSTLTNRSQFEDDKFCISECLEKLEQKLIQFSGSWGTALVSVGVSSDNMGDKNHNGTQKDNRSANNGSFDQKDTSMTNGSIYHPGAEKLQILENNVVNPDVRLQVHEMNRYCPEQSLESHQNGQEEILIIKEIAHQFEELRRLVLKEHCYAAH